MNGAFYIGATGLHAQQVGLDVLANNIANVNTTGYKRSRVSFGELVGAPPELSEAALGRPTRQALAGVAVNGDRRAFEQGELRPTNDPQSIAINGSGFIELLGPGGQSVLWRGGTLKVSREGYLAAENGMMLRAAIQVPPETQNLSIDPDGRVFVSIQGEAEASEIGRIDLVMVRDTDGLSMVGDALYQPEDALDLATVVPGAEGGGTLLQGAVESSNVKLTDEMVALLLTQRSFAANAQVLQIADELMSIANNLKR